MIGGYELAENKNAQQVREITDKLEQGIKDLFESEKYKEYLRTMSKFYNYSFNNTLLIAMQKPDATLIAGYTSWQRNFDRHVLKGEKGIKILAPAPYKVIEERDKLDPSTQKPIADQDGNALKETVEVTRPAFKVVSVFDVSQTDGKEIPDITVNELTGSVENYNAFFEALKKGSPVPIAFEGIPGGAKGYYHLEDRRIAIQENMSEIQTIKTAIHEVAHAKLHALDPDGKRDPEKMKDSRTREVEAESVAYTVCQRYGIETSDYSFGYVAGWSSGKEAKELKASLETIRATAAEMIESIDEKLKTLLTEKQTEKAQETVVTEKPPLEVPIYREVANYAYEAGELDAYRASYKANVACKNAIEKAIADHYGDNRLSDEGARSVLAEFGAERVQYILANTVQHKDWDGRISNDNKEWAKTVPICAENSEHFIVEKAHTGLMDLFLTQTRKEIEAAKRDKSADNSERDPEVVAWEEDRITSIEKTVVEVKSPIASTPENIDQKHRLTPDERKIKDAAMDRLKEMIAVRNDGILANYKASPQSQKTLMAYHVKIEKDTVLRNGEPLFHVQRRFASKKTQGCYRELNPTLEYVKPEKKVEKASIRDQLKAAAKEKSAQQKPEKQKSKGLEME
jgi:antirestriction protein ArdC